MHKSIFGIGLGGLGVATLFVIIGASLMLTQFAMPWGIVSIALGFILCIVLGAMAVIAVSRRI